MPSAFVPSFPFPLALLTFVHRYIQFYLDLVATAENVSLLYHLATKGKTVRDHTSFTHSEVSFLLDLPGGER